MMTLQVLVKTLSRVYQLALRSLPKSFRDEYGQELLLFFSDSLNEAAPHGRLRVAALAMHSIADVVRTAFREHASEFLRRNTRQAGRCTPRVEAALAFADREAASRARRHCSDDLVVLGLVRETDGLAAIALTRLGLDFCQMRSATDGVQTAGDAPWAPSAQADRRLEILAAARAEAAALGHPYVGTEHLLLGLLANPQPVLAMLLQHRGLSAERLAEETRAVLNEACRRHPARSGPESRRMTGALMKICLAAALLLALLYLAVRAVRQRPNAPVLPTVSASGDSLAGPREGASSQIVVGNTHRPVRRAEVDVPW